MQPLLFLLPGEPIKLLSEMHLSQLRGTFSVFCIFDEFLMLEEGNKNIQTLTFVIWYMPF